MSWLKLFSIISLLNITGNITTPLGDIFIGNMSNSTEINQQYFNKIAADYDKRFAKSFAAVNAELQANADFIGIKKGGRLLDYACGTGFVSISLSGFIGEAVGVDITENMIGAYNAKITNAVS
ncbi:hypothetical protein NLG97_g7571 [Lecanicillium saksenae]|uniref:Uncharacterized protein n=1 Tax=Lecanicillium saksenae TaxID=468837 RepID=A0ACC1QNZ2_9HYPO|nr:hypothetical protein NLG97_g7571 [Lecanicillium saksenae]